jgi:hypothetical protein
VWRNPANDFGDDILAAHYRAQHAARGGRPRGLTPPSAFRSPRSRARQGRCRPGAAGRSWWPGP